MASRNLRNIYHSDIPQSTLFTIIRPPDILIGGLRLRDSICLSILFSPATLGARWTELNQNRPYARK